MPLSLEAEYTVPIGKAAIFRPGEDLSVITYGAMVYVARDAAGQLEGEGISMEIVDLRTLAPLDMDTVLASVRKTSKVILLHEATLTGGLGGELAARITESAFDSLGSTGIPACVESCYHGQVPAPHSRSLRLHQRHGWRSKPGYAICVLDRGAVRFDFPKDWVVKQSPDCVSIHDREPPDDQCVLKVSFLKLPPADWSGLPLRELVQAATEEYSGEAGSQGQIIETTRGDLEIAWIEAQSMDEAEKREARSRLAIGRGSGIQCLITMDYWADHAKRAEREWDVVLQSLVLGLYVADPTRGPTVQ